MERLLLISHAGSGAMVLLLGFLLFVIKKGTTSHINLGRVYVGLMWWICLSAMIVISFYRFSAFLMVIAVLTFYATYSGLRVIRRKKSGRASLLDWVIASLTTCFGIGLFIYGLYIFYLVSGFHVLGMLCLIFGVFTASAGWDDIRFFRNPDFSNRLWWLKQHISAMGGSYIAAITAFAVQNGGLFQLQENLQWLLWVIPAVIGTPIISKLIKHHTRTSEKPIKSMR